MWIEKGTFFEREGEFLRGREGESERVRIFQRKCKKESREKEVGGKANVWFEGKGERTFSRTFFPYFFLNLFLSLFTVLGAILCSKFFVFTPRQGKYFLKTKKGEERSRE